MRRRFLLLPMAVVLCIALAACEFPEPKTQARFEITELRQEYYEYFEEYGYAYYRVTNTGSVDIDYYEVWIEVKCAGGTTYQDWRLERAARRVCHGLDADQHG